MSPVVENTYPALQLPWFFTSETFPRDCQSISVNFVKLIKNWSLD